MLVRVNVLKYFLFLQKLISKAIKNQSKKPIQVPVLCQCLHFVPIAISMEVISEPIQRLHLCLPFGLQSLAFFIIPESNLRRLCLIFYHRHYRLRHFISFLMIQAIIFHRFRPFSQDQNLDPHTTYVVCVHFIHQCRDLEFKVVFERQIFEYLLMGILFALIFIFPSFQDICTGF